MSDGGDDAGFRASLACQSCRQRKRKCDRQLPRCGLCERRGLECVISVARNAEGREGMVEGLEREVAFLEAQFSQMQATRRLRHSPGPGGKASEAESTRHLSSPPATGHTSPETVDLNVLKDMETASLYRGELYGLEEMTRRALRLCNDDPRGLSSSRSRKSLISSSKRSRDSAQGAAQAFLDLDKETTARYAKNFFSHILPTFPVVKEAEICHILELMLQGRMLGAKELIMAYLVLAMGAVLPSQSSVMDAANSAKFFLSAASVQVSYDESLQTVQILILFTIYSLFDPTTGNSWQLIELVMQVCIVLGLHQAGVEEANGLSIFQAAYTLDFLISTALGLPMSIRNNDITLKSRTLQPLDEPEEHSSMQVDTCACKILTPLGIFSWAYELNERPHHGAAEFFRVYDAHISHDVGATDSNTRKYIPSILGWHLSLQSLRKMTSSDATNAICNGQLINQWLAIPKSMPTLIVLPWTAGYVAFHAILLQMMICGGAPHKQSRLIQSVSHSNTILSIISPRFEGLKPHAGFGNAVLKSLVNQDERGMFDIDFLEGSELYQLGLEALYSVGMGVE